MSDTNNKNPSSLNGSINLSTLRGYSSYQLAQLEESFSGTLQEYLNSLHGKGITNVRSDEEGTLIITVEDLNGYKADYQFYKVIPIKGTDYFTDDEVNAIKQSISDTLVEYVDLRFKDKTDLSIKDITDTVAALKTRLEKDVNDFQSKVKESVDLDLANKRDNILSDIASQGEETIQALQNSSAVEVDKINELLDQSDSLLKEITDEITDKKDSALKEIEDLQSSQEINYDVVNNKLNDLEVKHDSDIDELKEIVYQFDENKADKEAVDGLKETKVDKEDNKGLSTNDYTNEEKEKLTLLKNYDDTEVKESIKTNVESIDELKETINNHKTRIETLESGGDVPHFTIKNTASGASINLTDSADAPIQNMVITPTDESVTRVDVTVCGKNIANNEDNVVKESHQTIANQPYCYLVSDKLVIGKKYKIVITGLNYRVVNIAQMGFGCNNNYDTDFYDRVYKVSETNISASDKKYVCSFTAVSNTLYFKGYVGFALNTDNFYKFDSMMVICDTSDETYEQYKEQTATIDTELQTGWEELKTYYPVTNIIPTQSATIDVEYVADTKNYIDNKLAELTALTLEG